MVSPDIQAGKSALIVLGMHRSGTSAMAGVLSLYGAKGPKNPLPPSGTNIAGYFESEPITKLNDEILYELDSSWNDVFAGQPKSYISNFDHFYCHKAQELLRDEYSNAGDTIVLKDPRINVLVGLWHRALQSSGYNPFYIIMVRHPLEVASSLRVRDQIPVEQGLLLWLDNMLAAERDTRDARRIFITYEDLLSGWPSVVDRIERISGVPMPRRTPAASNQIGLFLSSAKRHHMVDALVEDQCKFGKQIIPAYEWFHAAAQDDGGQPSLESLDIIRTELRQFYEVFGPVLAGQQSRISDLQKNISEYHKHTSGLEKLVEHLKQTVSEAEKRQAESYTEFSDGEKAAEAIQYELNELRARETALEVELNAKTELVAELERRQNDDEAERQQAAEEEAQALEIRHLELREELSRLQALSENVLVHTRQFEKTMSDALSERLIQERFVTSLEQEKVAAEELGNALQFELETAQAQLTTLEHERYAANERAQALQHELEHVLSSKSWKITSLPRRLINHLRLR